MPEALTRILRGVEEVISEEELKRLLSSKRPLRIKYGVDPTSPKLHLGHTVPFKKLRTFQELGHTVVFIVGDFTARIGDPSGQSATRPTLTQEEIERNARDYEKQAFRILVQNKTEVRRNSEWLSALGAEGLLRLSGLSTVARMLERDDFEKRYRAKNPITISEFLYPLLQGYDSVAVKADVEIGGTDQKFNLLCGREIQKDFGQRPQVVLTLPLLEGTDGVRKMSKSYKNEIALEDSPPEMFGKLMSIPDSLLPKYITLLTEEPLPSREEHPKKAKERLAEAVVSQFHGATAALAAAGQFEKAFSQRDSAALAEEIFVDGKSRRLSALLVEYKVVASRKEAQRLIAQGAVEWEGRVVKEDEEIRLQKQTLLKVGKRRFLRLILTTGSGK